MIAVATLASNTDQGMRQGGDGHTTCGGIALHHGGGGLGGPWYLRNRLSPQKPRPNEMFGHTGEELKGRPIEDLLPDAARAHHVHHRANYAEHPVPRSMGMGMDSWGQRKDGSIFPVEVSLNHFNVKGRMYVMGLITDVTLRHQAEQALHRSKQDLEERVEQRTAYFVKPRKAFGPPWRRSANCIN